MRKGLSEIATAALYVGVTVSAISVALTAGVPALENMRDAASVRKAQTFMQDLDSDVQEIVAEGEGSTRTVDISFDRGEIYFDNDTESLIYELQTDANVISPQSSRTSGNVVLSSNADVTVENSTIDGTDCYMMRNDHIEACIKKVGGSNNFQSINTTNLVVEYNFTDPEPDKEFGGEMRVRLNSLDNTSWGQGYTSPEAYGDFLGTGRVKAIVTSDFGYTYDVIFALPTGADFLRVDVKNFR